MGVFDVLKFWKKREAKAEKLPETPSFAAPMPPEPPATPSLPGFNIPKLPEQPDSIVAPAPEFQPFPQPAALSTGAPGAAVSSEKDFQLISAKLDALRTKLDLIDQRILKIEKIAEESR